MTMDWSPIVNVLIQIAAGLLTVLAPLIAAAAFAYLANLASKVKNEQVRAALMELVFAAEQKYGKGNGQLKRAYVEEQAAAANMKITEGMLEGTVFNYLGKKARAE